MEGARIKGPCFIGKNTMIGNNAIVRNNVDIEENCVIGANMEIKNSFVMKNSKTHSGFIGDSIIGENVRLGANFDTANVRLDRETVKIEISGEKIDTGLKKLGTIVGSGVKIGIKSSTMPGIMIGGNSTFQKNKLTKTNIHKHFKKENIHIAERKEELLKKVFKKYNDRKVFL